MSVEEIEPWIKEFSEADKKQYYSAKINKKAHVSQRLHEPFL